MVLHVIVSSTQSSKVVLPPDSLGGTSNQNYIEQPVALNLNTFIIIIIA